MTVARPASQSTSERKQRHRPVRALVTGGGGFLGRAVVEQLLARGDEVRSFSRDDYPELRELGAETIRGDLADAAAVRAACSDRDVVFHVAAKPGVWGRYRDYYAPNVRGTENVLSACRAQGVGRLVYTSSPSVVFDGRDMAGADESVPYAKRPPTPYSQTKRIAEQQVLSANTDALRTLALRPHLIWGPRDKHIVPRLIARARAGKLRRVGDGSNEVDTTYIDNAAAAHLAAADALDTNPAAAGRAYFITNGEPLPLWSLIDRILAAADLPPVKRSISPVAARAVGGVLESLHLLFRPAKEPMMTRFVAKELSTDHWFDISAAKRELGYEPKVTVDEGMQRLAAWLRSRS